METLTADREVADWISSHASDRDPRIRAWVADAIVAAASEDVARTVLRKLSRDRDPDVRDGAQERLLEIGTAADRQWLKRAYVRQLDRTIPEATAALWSLVRLRDTSAIPDIESFALDPKHPWKALAAPIAIAVIEGRRAGIVRGIRDHDHDRMLWLSVGAGIEGSAECRAALTWGAESLPDSRCRSDCRSALARMPRVPVLVRGDEQG